VGLNPHEYPHLNPEWDDTLMEGEVFTAEPGAPGFTAASVLFLEHRQLHTGKQTVTVVVDQQPTYAGVDPYNKRIDRNSDDNVAPVELR